MRHTKRFVALAVVIMAFLGSLLVLLQFKTPEPVGAWKDVNADYYVVFYSNGTYAESTYNIPCKYSYDESTKTLTLNSVDESVSTTTLRPSFHGDMQVLINDTVRVLESVNYSPRLYTWGSELSGKILGVYEPADTFSVDVSLYLYDDFCFEYNIGSTSVVGKYAYSRTGTLMLLTDQGETVEYLRIVGDGFAAGEINTDVRATVVKSNAIEDRGLILEGVAYDQYTSVTYVFGEDGFLKRTDSDDTTLEFMYYVDMAGHVIAVDSVGYGATFEMWYDTASSTLYRYVLERDTWTDYLITAGGGDTSEG